MASGAAHSAVSLPLGPASGHLRRTRVSMARILVPNTEKAR